MAIVERGEAFYVKVHRGRSRVAHPGPAAKRDAGDCRGKRECCEAKSFKHDCGDGPAGTSRAIGKCHAASVRTIRRWELWIYAKNDRLSERDSRWSSKARARGRHLVPAPERPGLALTASEEATR